MNFLSMAKINYLLRSEAWYYVNCILHTGIKYSGRLLVLSICISVNLNSITSTNGLPGRLVEVCHLNQKKWATADLDNMTSLEEADGADDGSPPMAKTPIRVLQTSNRFCNWAPFSS